MKIIKNNLLSFVVFLFLFTLFTTPAFAWNSLWYYSHEALADDAIHVLPSMEYPDLYKFEEQLRDGSESEAGHPGGTLSSANGGDVYSIWTAIGTHLTGGVLVNYKKYKFSDAYLNIGRIAHLTQDQAVPAHAANINHFPSGDKFETYADDHYVRNPSNGYSYSFPYQYYLPLQNDTRSKLSGWIKPSSGEQYWIPAATIDQVGHYGGDGNSDVYYSGIWPIIWGCESPEIVGSQNYMGIRYSAGIFAAASMKLPPLIKDIKITSNCGTVPTIGKQSSVQISFKILENRKKTVKIFMTVDGEAIISAEYGTGKSFDLSSGSDLPWEGTYTISWDGKLASGQYPSDGEHTLYVTQCEVTSQKCEKISLERCFANSAISNLN